MQPKADDELSPDLFDGYLHIKLTINRGGKYPEFCRVTERLKNKDSRSIGKANDNSILNTRMYKVEFVNGHQQAMTANIIAQNMFAQVDADGHC